MNCWYHYNASLYFLLFFFLFQGAASGIFLLHETYNLDLKKFVEGELEIPGEAAASSEHLFEFED